MISFDSAIDIKDLSQKSEITVLFLEIRIIGDKHIIYISSPIVLQMEIRRQGNYYRDEGSLQSRVKYDVRNYKCCYSNSYVQTVTDIQRHKKRRFNLVLKPTMAAIVMHFQYFT
jgi:hypothetical protein